MVLPNCYCRHSRPLAVLSDATRVRVLVVLERHELAVSELCEVLQLPQSTVSRHLKTLADDGWVGSRREGTSRLYRSTPRRCRPPRRALAARPRPGRHRRPPPRQDARRWPRVLAARAPRRRRSSPARPGSGTGCATSCSARRRRQALLGLLDPDWVVADLGCGTGHVASLLAPFVRRVIAVDASAAMLGRGRARSAPATSTLRQGALEALPHRRRRARRRAARPRAAPRPRPGAGAGRSRARPQARRPPRHRRHAPARSRGVPPADGARLARLRRAAAYPPAARRRGFEAVRVVPLPPKPRPKGRRCSLASARQRRSPVHVPESHKESL